MTLIRRIGIDLSICENLRHLLYLRSIFEHR
jgi:hypothetical protein